MPDKTARMLRFDLRHARAKWIKEVEGKTERRIRHKSDFLRKGYSIDSTYPHWLWLAACQSDPPTMLL